MTAGHVKAVDPAHVTMIEVTLPFAAFSRNRPFWAAEWRRDQEALTAEFVRKSAEEQRLIVETWKAKGLLPNRDTESLRSLMLSGTLFP